MNSLHTLIAVWAILLALVAVVVSGCSADFNQTNRTKTFWADQDRYHHPAM